MNYINSVHKTFVHEFDFLNREIILGEDWFSNCILYTDLGERGVTIILDEGVPTNIKGERKHGWKLLSGKLSDAEQTLYPGQLLFEKMLK